MSSLIKPPLTPIRAIQQMTENDPTFTECDLTGNATYLIKSSSFTKDIALALKTNTIVKRLVLSNVGITDASVKLIAEALKVNKTLTSLDLSKNKLGSAGLIDLAEALTHNATMLEIDLLGQSQPFGDQALSKVIAMFGYNITLKNISWRLQSRQSFAINKLIVRNNEIERRLSSGKSVLDILPEARKADFGGVPGESYSPPEGTTQALSNEEHEVKSPRLDQALHASSSSSSSAVSSLTASNPSTPSRPELLKKTNTTSSPANLPRGTGKMLNRYLQAAQATDTKDDSVKSVAASSGATKLTSFFESKMEEASTTTARIPPTKPVAVRTTTGLPTSPRSATSPRDPFSARTTSQITLSSASAGPTMSSHSSSTSSHTPGPVELAGKVSSIKEKFIVKETEQSPAISPVTGTQNKVSAVWTPTVAEVKKTTVEPVVDGTSNKLALWQQRLEEAQKQQEEASLKKPIKSQKATKSTSDTTNMESEPQSNSISTPQYNAEPQPETQHDETQPETQHDETQPETHNTTTEEVGEYTKIDNEDVQHEEHLYE
eukprot:TRINITY_DN563_c0_g1_i1.p1 TRINITY_DN563_c0_g1~~TRINITY_DN563_c0_g1_i1.p1  ORF type:complete len:548 (-),score=147.21 TRINITY_DN563_c0_g1_i1:58-1701(-)